MVMPAFKRLAHSTFFKLAVKAALTLATLWFVCRGIDFVHLLEILEQQNRMLLVETTLLMILQSLLGGVRWKLVTNALAATKAHCITMWESQKIYYIGVFFTTCLPGTVGGDVVRIWMAKGLGIPLSQAINAVIIDRMIALFGIGVMVLATLPVFAGLLQLDSVAVYSVSALLVVLGFVTVFFLERVLTPHGHLRPVQWLLHFLSSLKLIMTHPYVCASAIMLALVAHVSYSLSAYVMAQSLGIPMTVMQSMAFIPLVMLITTIPISIGGWGVREASMVGLLGLVGIGQEAALMLSVQMGLLFMVISLPASVLWLMSRKRQGRPDAAELEQAL